MKINKMTIAVVAFALTAMTGCKKDQFDQKVYQGSVDAQFMIDNADPDHDWCLTKSDTITINTSEEKIYSVQVLTANPYGTAKPEIAAEGVCYGNHATLAYTIPITQSTVYIAALDNEGSYLGAMPFQYGTEQIDLLSSLLTKGSSLTSPTAQTFTYLYESTFPSPDDFDYNDMVLRISKSMPNPGNAYIVDLTVTLEAVGAGELYAGAIQLDGIRMEDIEKVEIVGGKAMDDGYPIDPATFIKNKDVWQEGKTHNVLIRLFECAQFAISKKQDYAGDIAIIRYNTARTDRENYSATVDPLTVTYRIYFKDADKAHSLTFDRIDPFIIHQYNIGHFEVHTYAHKFDLCISNLDTNLKAYDNHISWAVVIPKGDFRYPIENMPLSTFSTLTGSAFGPYDGFATWMGNHLISRDWYLTPTRPQLLY
jgi:LruC domain-containing protein